MRSTCLRTFQVIIQLSREKKQIHILIFLFKIGCEKALKYEVELLKNLRKLRETLVEHRNRLQELNTRSKSTDGFLDYNKTFR